MSNLPANLSNFLDGVKKNHAPVHTAGGKPYLKFSGKTGGWMMGKDETEVDGEEAIINLAACRHGYVRWGEMPPAKCFSPINEPLPEKPEDKTGIDFSTKQERLFSAQAARQLEGRFVDETLGEFIFDTNSMGGVERVDELISKAIARMIDGTEYVFPKIALEEDFYKRPDGKVFKPLLTVVAWCNTNGEEEGEEGAEPDAIGPPAKAEPKTSAEPKAKRRRRTR